MSQIAAEGSEIPDEGSVVRVSNSARSSTESFTEGSAPINLSGIQGLSPDDFKTAFRNHPAGVAVITADSGDGPVALTATSVVSVSAVPPLLIFSLSSNSSATPAIRTADTAVIHLLSVEDLSLAKLCSAPGAERFGDAEEWGRLPSGEPYYSRVKVRIRARIVDRMEAGASVVIAAHALEAHLQDVGGSLPAPLVYHDRTWHGLGGASRL